MKQSGRRPPRRPPPPAERGARPPVPAPEGTAARIAGKGASTLRDLSQILDQRLTHTERVYGQNDRRFADALENYALSLRRMAGIADMRSRQIRNAFEHGRMNARESTGGGTLPESASLAAPRGPNRLVGVRAAAAYLTIGAETLYGLVRSGEIPHSRVGRSIRLRVSDLDQYVENHTSQKWTRVDGRGRPRRR